MYPRLAPARRCLVSFFGALIGVLLLALPALAHHSGAMFDRHKVIELHGTIKAVQWTNPHIWIQIDVKNAEGVTEEWSIEGGSPGTLSRNGWRATTFKPGDGVAMKIRPMKDNSRAGSFVGAKFADGRTIGKWNDENEE